MYRAQEKNTFFVAPHLPKKTFFLRRQRLACGAPRHDGEGQEKVGYAFNRAAAAHDGNYRYVGITHLNPVLAAAGVANNYRLVKDLPFPEQLGQSPTII